MFGNFIDELTVFIVNSKVYLMPWLICLGVLWAFNILNWSTGSRLNVLGIYPRTALGLVGILFCPLLHQNVNHLFFNSIPLFILGLALLARGVEIFCWVTTIVMVVGGLAVWLMGRRSMHIGASGLISGYFGFILVTAYFQPDVTSIILALLVAYYFGGIFIGLFPQEEKVSWESHLFGFLSGVLSAYLLKLTMITHFLQTLFAYS